MKISKNFLSGCIVLMSSSLMLACDPSSTEQASGLNTGSSPATVTSSKTGPSVDLSSDNINTYKGETFELDVHINDFISSEGGGITLRFNPALLQVVSVNIDETVWDFVNKAGKINNAEGKVSDILFSSYQGVVGDAKIATIEFKSIEQGSSTIALESSSSNPFASNGEVMDVSFTTTSVSSN